MFDCRDSQDVGLEAATIERVRNSSLVKWSRAENVTGLKFHTEVADFCLMAGVVAERRVWSEAAVETVVDRARVRMLV